MKQEEESLYAIYNELVNKRKTFTEIRDEIESLKLRKKYVTLKQKLETLTNSLDVMGDSQEKINSKKAATIMKLQRDSSSTFDKENILLLPQKYHKSLKNIVGNQEKIENLLYAGQVNDNYETVEQAIIESQNVSSTWNKQLAKDVHIFKSSEGLYKNVLLMKKLNTDESITEEIETESDLGCYPHDSNSANINSSLNDSRCFVTSSPIYKVSKSRIRIKLPSEAQSDI